MRLFGGFEVQAGSGRSLAVPTRKAQALLAYLALTPGEAHPRDKLAALLWAEASPAAARNALRQTLFVLRKALGSAKGALLIVTGDALTLPPDAVQTDVVAFEQAVAAGTTTALEGAAALYRGDLLAGLTAEAPGFEDWLMSERERLRELAIESFARLLAQRRAAGATEAAVQLALRLLALDPLQEAVHRTLMRLYAQLGRRDAALRQYQVCVAALQRELAAEPEAETTELYRDIVRRQARATVAAPPRTTSSASRAPVADLRGVMSEATTAPTAAGVPPAQTVVVAAPEIPVHETPMVGRATEIARLRDLFDRASRGAGSVVLITGEPGVGKSRLVAELAADALARGGHVLLGRCHSSTQILPFGPWVDAFRLGGVIGAATLGTMEPAWRAELARLFPEAGGPGLPASSENPLRLFEAVGQLMQRVAHARPTVVVLEDCHWADEMTLSLVAFVARQIGSWPVMLVVTVREDETAETPLVQRTLAELRQARAAQLLALAPLARADVGDLVRAVLGPGVEARRAERLETRVWTTSEGNAFVALEALRAWGRDVRAEAEPPLSLPERVRELVTTRLARLSDVGRKAVAVAAVLGREFDFALLQHAAELSEEDAASALEELVRRRVVGGVGESFQFTHDRIREVAHDELLPQRRRLIHARVVNALETLCGGEIDAHALRLAQHCREAALWDKAVGHWRRAAAQAAERSALPQAVECLEGALAALDRLPGDRRDVVERSIDVRIDLRGALFAGRGEVDRVRDVLATAAALASEIGDSRRLARVLVLQAHNYGIVAGEIALGEQCARRALTVAESLQEPGLVGLAGSLLGRVQYGRGAHGEAIAALRHSIEFIETTGADEYHSPLWLPVSLGSRVWLAFALAEVGRFAEAMATADEAVRQVQPPASPYVRCHQYWARAAVHLERGEHEQAADDIEHMWVTLRETDMPRIEAHVSGLTGHAHALAGRAREAVTFLERSLAGARDSFAGHRDVFYLGDAYLRARRLDDAFGTAERVLALARSCEQPGREARALWLLGNVRRTRGEHAEAQTVYGQALALATALGMRPLVAHCHASLAVLSAQADRHAQADEHAALSTALYAEMEMPYWQRAMEGELAAAPKGSS
jgi:DNA-binding SARP family transcriptional activator